MFDRRSWMMGVGCALALLAPSRVVGADGDQMFATVATPAVVTVKARAAIERLGNDRVAHLERRTGSPTRNQLKLKE